MKTDLTYSPKIAARVIQEGEVAAFPTETVYGLGANVFDEDAVMKIFKAKGRPAGNPLIVHIAYKTDIKILAKEIPDSAKKIIRKYFPGPITLVLKKNEIISDIVTAGLDTVAIRMPSSKIAKEFIKECDVPIAAPSANLSGSPSPTSFVHVLNDFKGKISCILIGPNTKHGLESTVVDCSVEPPVILRPGVVTLEMLKDIDKRICVASKSKSKKSPGMRYKHYAPKANVVLVKREKSKGKRERSSAFGRVKSEKQTAYIGTTKPKDNFEKVLVCKLIEVYAKNLFSFFRECDEDGIKTIYAEEVPEKGIGVAIMNRLKKASSIINC